MSITQEQVKHIANLSRLKLNEEDIEKYSKDLNSIVDYINILSQVDDKKLEGISVDGDSILPLREDKIQKSYIASRDELLSCSPKKIINHSVSINNIMDK